MKLMFFLLSLSLFAKIDVQGHRGARGVLPENTIPAFAYALGVGVDTIELDLVVSKDHKVIVGHDLEINTTICKYPKEKTKVYSLTLEQVQKIDCGSKKNPQFKKQASIPGAKMPSLVEVFEYFKKSKNRKSKLVKFNIEMKMKSSMPDASPSPKKFANLVYNIIKSYNMGFRTTIQSFDPRPLLEIKKFDPKMTTALLTYKEDEDLLKSARQAKVDIISPHYKKITKAQIDLLQKNGIKVIPWTPNKIKEWEKLISLRVDGIITDYPKALIKLLKIKGLR